MKIYPYLYLSSSPIGAIAIQNHLIGCMDGKGNYSWIILTGVSLIRNLTTVRWAHYIHANTVQHRLTKTIAEWPYHSYHALVNKSDGDTKFCQCKEELLDWFGGVEGFIKFHTQAIVIKE